MRFREEYQTRIVKYCNPDKMRHAQFDQAMAALSQMCDCGGTRALDEDNKLLPACQQCLDIEAIAQTTVRRGNRARKVADKEG